MDKKDAVINALREYWRAFENAERVDLAPVVHGRWKEDTGGYGFWICSHCGFVSEASAANLLYRYCPLCGAKMDGKDGEQYAEGIFQKERS